MSIIPKMCDRKPNCSYNCLIGMALKSSESGRLPVGEIYRFFEREFPYFLTAAEPWKNSLRHSLSLGHYFRKYNSDKLVTKKGHLWEVDPQRAAELDKEMYMFLARGLPENVPTSPQLSQLRLQMTQILLDTMKSPPPGSYHHHHHGHPQCHMAMQPPILGAPYGYTPPKLAMYHPQRGAVGESLIQSPAGSPLSEMTPRRRGVLCQAATSPIASPNFTHGRPTVGSFLASAPIARSKQAMSSPQYLHIPRATSGGGTLIKKLTPGSSSMQAKRRSDLAAHLQQSPRSNSIAATLQSPKSASAWSGLQSPSPRTTTGNAMCTEAYQLMQFCNHCSVSGGAIGASKSNERSLRELASPVTQQQTSSLQRENSHLSTSELCQDACNRDSSHERICNSPLDPKLADLLSENSHHHQQQIEENQGASYYPFIAPPTGNRNVSLSQLNNNGNYQMDPGQPKELNINKCNPKCRGDAGPQQTTFDSAVRPVVYDWNGWWEAEHVLCLMNEESYMNYIECRSEESVKKIKKHSYNDKTMLTTLTTERWQRRSCSHFGFRRGSGQNWVRRLKIRKPVTPSPSPSPSPPPTPQGRQQSVTPTPTGANLPDNNAHMAAVEENLKLIVSIPFRQLVTDRQMKKYCTAGAKHRISTAE